MDFETKVALIVMDPPSELIIFDDAMIRELSETLLALE